MVEFFAGVVAGISAVALLVIVLAPSRRIRAEARIDREIETRLLLGVNPDVDTDAEPAPTDGTTEHRPRSEFGAAELQALRKLGTESGSSRRRSESRRK